MLKLLTDEHVPTQLVLGLLRRESTLDVVQVRDVGLRSRPDPELLEWAAGEGRVLITYDVNIMPGFAYDRVRRGSPMPGVFATF